MAEMFYSEKIQKVSWILEETVNKLDSNHWTVACTVVMGLELQERLSAMNFLYLKLTIKKNIQKMY